MRKSLIILLSCFLSVESLSVDIFNQENTVLPADQAFAIKKSLNDENIEISWMIKDGYYMYLNSIKILNGSNEISYKVLESNQSLYEDEFFGKTTILKKNFVILSNILNSMDASKVTIQYQGCSEAGFCYPVQKQYLL